MTAAMDYSGAFGSGAGRWLNTAVPVMVAVLAMAFQAVGADAGKAATNSPAALAKADFQARQIAYKGDSTNTEITGQFARACFDWAEFATNDTQRADLAQLGIKACRELIARNSNSVQGHYYLGMNLGQLARTKSLGALRLVGQMEAAFTTARGLDEKFDFAGPDRNLGLLYFEAPSGISVGDDKKARKHLQRAVELAPEFPDNRLNLAEAHIRWKEFEAANKEAAALEAALPGLKERFKGDSWAGAWADWEKRLAKLRDQLKGRFRKSASPKDTP